MQTTTPIVPTEHYALVKQWLKTDPNVTHTDLAQRYQGTYKRALSARTMGRVLGHMEQTRKKGHESLACQASRCSD